MNQPQNGLHSGTVTFLFTDIQGSTKLLKQLGKAYASLLAEHHAIMRSAIEKFEGHEVDTQGDAFFVSFPRATQAVAAVTEIQRAFATHSWSSEVEVRVRMGLHTGEPWLVEQGYVGMDVHRAARIAHVAHGGQVLLSETTFPLVQDELPEGVALLDLGQHRLKDMRRPEHIRQLVIDGLDSEFPPIKSLEDLSEVGILEAETARHPPQDVGTSPYRGLSAFHEDDATFFFGREAFSELLMEAIVHRQLVAVIVGSSGSGKSSAVFAGLLPRMRENDDWLIVQLRPGSGPFHSLAGALVPLLEDQLSETEHLVEAQRLAVALRAGEVSLSRVVERILGKHPAAHHLLLVIDQFEELFTLNREPEKQMAFLDELLASAQYGAANQTSPVVSLLTLRADFMGQALTHRPFADALQEGSLMLGPMNREELRAAIEKPAELQGASFEVGLVSRILDDVGQEPGNLPLLEFALTLLWDRMDKGWMTHEIYEEIGRVDGALARYADEVYSRLTTEEQEQAGKAFVQLVQPGQGTEDTRRVARREDLVVDWGLIQRLADARLVVTGLDQTGNETVEVVHEALIRGWGQLRSWMAADRAFRNWQEGLRAALHGWENSERDEGALLRGAPLAQSVEWLAERSDEIGGTEKTYIQASVEFNEKEQRRRERRRQLTIGGLAVGLVITILLSVFAFQQRLSSLEQRQSSLLQSANLLARQAETELANGYHDRAILLALEALENYPYTSAAEHALGQAVSYSRALGIYSEHSSAVTSVAWSPDGKLVATSASSDNTVHVWDPVTGETVLVIDMPTGITGNKLDMALHVQWTPDGKHLLTVTGDRYTLGSQDYDVLLWDANSGELLSSVEIPNQAEPESGDLGVSFVNYPTGAAAKIALHSGRLATLGGDNTALIWDTDWKQVELTLSGHTKSVNSVDWSPDGVQLVTASLDGTARIWDTQTGEELQVLEGHEGRVNIALWSPDGTQIATAGDDGTMRIWDAQTGEVIRNIEANAGSLGSLVWSPNSKRLITGHEDGSIRIWKAETGELLETVRGHQGIISDLKWSPVDDRVVSGDGQGTIRIWNMAYSTAWRVYPPQAQQEVDWSVQGASWSNDSRYLAMAGGDPFGATDPPSFEIWDVYENKLIMQNLGDKLNFMGLQADFSPDNKAILYLGFPGFPDFSGLATAYVFDAQTGEIIKTFTPDNGVLIRSAAWSPDGSQIATGMFNNQILIWDYTTGKQIATLIHSNNESMFINNVEWSPDGSKIAGASDESSASVWDAHTWELLYKVEHDPPAFVGAASWSPDGTSFVTNGGNDEQGAKDTTARIWDSTTGEELLAFAKHTKAVFSGDWSPNGLRVVTSSNDGTVRVWDSSTGDELLTFTVPVVYGIVAWWSPDGKHLAIVGSETLVSVWNVWESKDELITYARECCVIRDLTTDERQQFGLP